MNGHRLVYSTDPKLNQKCARCKELVTLCMCSQDAVIPEKITATLSIEKAKRGGKTVTVIGKLPANEEFLQGLAKQLKQSCGAGGTHRIEEGIGYIEIQGDRREMLRTLLPKRKIAVKG